MCCRELMVAGSSELWVCNNQVRLYVVCWHFFFQTGRTDSYRHATDRTIPDDNRTVKGEPKVAFLETKTIATSEKTTTVM